MKLSGQQRKKIAKALLDAFPTKSWLEQMLYYEQNKKLNLVTYGNNLEELVFNLIQTAEAENSIEVDWIVNTVNQLQAEKQPYFFFLSREDL